MFACENRSNLALYYDIVSTYNPSDEYLSGSSIYQSFPSIHYVQRPQVWDTDYKENFTHGGTDRIDPQYVIDFPSECTLWELGGFKFLPQTNIDFYKSPIDQLNTSKPQVGFTEVREFGTRIIWTEVRNINQQDSPQLKTIYANNKYDLADAYGCIKYLYSNNSSKGDNLIALTERGVCLVITNKRIISDYNVDQLGLADIEEFIQGQYWLSRIYGVNDEMWRSCAEFDNILFFTNNESVFKLDGVSISDIGRKNSGNYYNKYGENNGGYYSKLYPTLKNIELGYLTRVSAVYNRLENEYWLSIDNVFANVISYTINMFLSKFPDGSTPSGTLYEIKPDEILGLDCGTTNYGNAVLPMTGFNTGDIIYLKNKGSKTISLQGMNATQQSLNVGISVKLTKDTSAYGWTISLVERLGDVYVFGNKEEIKAWIGTFDYKFDKYLCVNKINGLNDLRVVGMRDLSTYKLDIGNIINGDKVESKVRYSVSANTSKAKEFVDLTISSSAKPTRVDFAIDEENLPECSLYEGMSVIPNTYYLKNYNGWYNFIPRKLVGNRDRMQGRKLITEITYKGDDDFELISVETGYKLLK